MLRDRAHKNLYELFNIEKDCHRFTMPATGDNIGFFNVQSALYLYICKSKVRLSRTPDQDFR